jgi:hypothetical protein
MDDTSVCCVRTHGACATRAGRWKIQRKAYGRMKMAPDWTWVYRYTTWEKGEWARQTDADLNLWVHHLAKNGSRLIRVSRSWMTWEYSPLRGCYIIFHHVEV